MNLYRAYFVPNGTDPSGKKCRIRVRCWDVIRGVKLNIHCGLEIESDIPPLNGDTDDHVVYDGGDDGHIHVGDPNDPLLQDLPGVKRGEWVDYDDGVCKCLIMRREVYNGFNVPYEKCNFEQNPEGELTCKPRNSNFAFKCFTKACGIEIPDWSTKGYGFDAVYRREYGCWVDDQGCSRCVETVAECPWDVPVIVRVW